MKETDMGTWVSDGELGRYGLYSSVSG